MLDAPKVLRPADLYNLKPAQRPGIPAVRALYLEHCLEADKIGCRADVLCGHSPAIMGRERFVNTSNNRRGEMSGEFGKKTWTPQQIPAGVHGTYPKPDKEPQPEPPKQPEKR